MANTPGAKKAVRKIERRTEVNKARRSRVRTYLRKFEEALTSGDAAAAKAAFVEAQSDGRCLRLRRQASSLAAKHLKYIDILTHPLVERPAGVFVRCSISSPPLRRIFSVNGRSKSGFPCRARGRFESTKIST